VGASGVILTESTTRFTAGVVLTMAMVEPLTPWKVCESQCRPFGSSYHGGEAEGLEIRRRVVPGVGIHTGVSLAVCSMRRLTM
jgi:hypothetical protein